MHRNGCLLRLPLLLAADVEALGVQVFRLVHKHHTLIELCRFAGLRLQIEYSSITDVAPISISVVYDGV